MTVAQHGAEDPMAAGFIARVVALRESPPGAPPAPGASAPTR